MQGFDVGGSHKSQQSGYESFGIQNQAKRRLRRHRSHRRASGGTGFYEDFYANEEVSVGALGSDVEMNSPGAAVVTTIKSGGNTFKGLEHLTLRARQLRRQQRRDERHRRTRLRVPANGAGVQQCNNPNLLFWEGHADLGGPIAQDKIWFYGAYNHFKIDKQVSGRGAERRHRSRDLRQLHGEGDREAQQEQHAHRLLPARPQAEAVPQPVDAACPPESILAQDSWSTDVQGRVAVRC